MTTLYIPLALAALGIVLRGSGFAFRHALPGPVRDPATRVFGISSLLTPFFMGTVVGAVASGEVPAGGNGDPTASWTGVLPLVTGALFVAVAAYSAAVFLVHDAGAAGDAELARLLQPAGHGRCGGRRHGRRRRTARAARQDAHFVYDGLTGARARRWWSSRRSAGWRRWGCWFAARPRGLRPAAVGAVVAVVWGYFAAQHPYMLPASADDLRRGRRGATLTAVIVVFGPPPCSSCPPWACSTC